LARLRRSLNFDVSELAPANHMHRFDAGDDDPSTAKCLESEHGQCDGFDGAMVLLNDIVEVLRLPHRDGQAAVGLHADNSRRVGSALVDSDFLGHVVQADSPFKERAGRSVIGKRRVNTVLTASYFLAQPFQAIRASVLFAVRRSNCSGSNSPPSAAVACPQPVGFLQPAGHII
jgi:hypothetical protein